MTPPDFWYDVTKSPGFVKGFLLSCLSWILYRGARLRALLTPCHKVDIPVICVGNFTVGGAGKTPTTLYLAQYLKDKGLKPAIISRGYRGRLRGPVHVDINAHTHLEVGDEPLMMAQYFDVYIARKRSQGAKVAQNNGADVIIMDDGLQHPSLHQDLKLSVIDAQKGFGNGKLLPAGPLREPIDVGLERIDGVILVSQVSNPIMPAGLSSLQKPCIQASVRVSPDDLQVLQTKPLVAFAGLAHPDKFFQMLKGKGLDVKHAISFPDHHAFSERDLQNLKDQADKDNASLVTTEKDFVRLPQPWRDQVAIVRIGLECSDTSLLDVLLNPICEGYRDHDH